MLSVQRLRELPTMRAKEYDILRMAVENGVRFGIARFEKHRDTPLTDEQVGGLRENLEREVLDAICEWFSFQDEAEE